MAETPDGKTELASREQTENRPCSCLGHCRGRDGLSDRYICALDGRPGKVMTPSTFRAVRQCERLTPPNSPPVDLSALWALVESWRKRADEMRGVGKGTCAPVVVGCLDYLASELDETLVELGVPAPPRAEGQQ